MREINILFLNVGRRVELVKSFLDTKKNPNYKIKIFGSDTDYKAPALKFVDKVLKETPVKSVDYIDDLIKTILENNISIVVPTIDTNLKRLSSNKNYIEKNTKAKLVLSDIKVIDIFSDKIKTSMFFERNNIKAPKRLTSNDDLIYPLIVKPRSGSSSKNVFVAKNQQEVDFFSSYIKDPLIQEFIDGDEYTIDMLIDDDGKPILIVPRKRIKIRGGEILQGKIEKNKLIIESIMNLVSLVNFYGPITVQVIVKESQVYFIEVNPRFGGGVPMSIKAGANFPSNLIKIVMNEKVEFQDEYQSGLIISRFDDSIIIQDEND